MSIFKDTIKNINKSSENEELPSKPIKTFHVYKHTFPNGKVYIGITGNELVEHRYGNNGNHYHKWAQPLMLRAIEKYGWENIRHETLASGLSKEDACTLEIKLIAEYQSSNPVYGYNLTLGGQYPTYTDESRAKMSAARLGTHPTDETRAKMSAAKKGTTPWNKGQPTSPETLAKLSAARKGRVAPNKGIAMTDEQKQKISDSKKGTPAWNKGTTVPYKARRPLTPEEKAVISAKTKAGMAAKKASKLVEEV